MRQFRTTLVILMGLFFLPLLTACDQTPSSDDLVEKNGLSLHLSFNKGEETELDEKGFKRVCGANYTPCKPRIEDNFFGREGVFSAQLNSNTWSWLDVLDHPDLSPADEMTLSAWIFPANHGCSSEGLTLAPHGHKVVGKTNSSFNGGYVLGISTNKIDKNYSLFAEVWDSEGKLHRLVGGQIPFGRWTHVAMTWRSGDAMKGYVNGKRIGLIKASDRPIGANNERFRIGIAPWDTNALAFGGGIDEIRLDLSQLNDDEVKDLYERTFSSTEGFKPNC